MTPATQTRTDIAQVNAIRIERCNLLKAITENEVDVCRLLIEESPGITFMELLAAIPRIGKHRASMILESLDLGEHLLLGEPSSHRRDLRDATQRERRILWDWIEAYEERRAA